MFFLNRPVSGSPRPVWFLSVFLFFFVNRVFSVDCFNKSVFEYVFVFFAFHFLAKTTLCGSGDVINIAFTCERCIE